MEKTNYVVGRKFKVVNQTDAPTREAMSFTLFEGDIVLLTSFQDYGEHGTTIQFKRGDLFVELTEDQAKHAFGL